MIRVRLGWHTYQEAYLFFKQSTGVDEVERRPACFRIHLKNSQWLQSDAHRQPSYILPLPVFEVTVEVFLHSPSYNPSGIASGNCVDALKFPPVTIGLSTFKHPLAESGWTMGGAKGASSSRLGQMR